MIRELILWTASLAGFVVVAESSEGTLMARRTGRHRWRFTFDGKPLLVNSLSSERAYFKKERENSERADGRSWLVDPPFLDFLRRHGPVEMEGDDLLRGSLEHSEIHHSCDFSESLSVTLCADRTLVTICYSTSLSGD